MQGSAWKTWQHSGKTAERVLVSHRTPIRRIIDGPASSSSLNWIRQILHLLQLMPTQDSFCLTLPFLSILRRSSSTRPTGRESISSAVAGLVRPKISSAVCYRKLVR